MRERIDKPERAHLSESLLAGSPAVLKARKMVFPSHKCQLDPGLAKRHTCLHPHENGPCIVGCSINEACKEAAY